MRKFVAVLFLLLCSTLGQAKDKPNPADYSIYIDSRYYLCLYG